MYFGDAEFLKVCCYPEFVVNEEKKNLFKRLHFSSSKTEILIGFSIVKMALLAAVTGFISCSKILNTQL